MIAPDNDPYPRLREPLILGGIALRNRIVHASITTFYVEQQKVTDRLIDYHRSRAKGGCGAIITEPLAIIPWQVDEGHKVRAFDDQQADGLARLAAAVEEYDCRLIGQVQDSGRGRHRSGRKRYSFAPSALPDDLSGTMPRALTIAQIQKVVEDIGRSTARLQRAGFAGVEISAGHGHLIHQFLSPWSNRREDLYGGDLEGRMRFLLEMVESIRAETKRPFVIAIKSPADDGVPGGIGPDDGALIAARLAATGQVDAFAFCHGSHHRMLERHVPSMHESRAPYDLITARLRQAAGGIPTAALGRLVDPVQAEAALQRGDADFAQIGRALITDPAWANKALEGREHELRSCVSCNTCWGLVVGGAPMACDNNPSLGTPDETDWVPARVLQPRTIVVVGAGPAGLEAAWTAAARGHHVTVVGRSGSYGGKLALLASLPGCDQLSSVYDYQMARALREGAQFVFGREMGLQDILALSPDTVVLATGSEMTWPVGWPEDWSEDGAVKDIRENAALFAKSAVRQSGLAVVVDQDHTAAVGDVAIMLAQHFQRTVIATPRGYLARDEPIVVQQSLDRRLAIAGVEIFPFCEICPQSELWEGRVSLRSVYTDKEHVFDELALLTYASPRKPNDALLPLLEAAGIEVRVIGDAYAPRDLLTATAEGNAIGLEI